MNILHINTSDTGGAAIAAIRLHQALLKHGIESNILFANQTRSEIPNAHSYRIKRKKYFARLLFSIKRKIGLSKTYWERITIQLKGQDKGIEAFSFPDSDFDITTQPVYQNADVIHLHWVSGFVDYKFFKKNIKPVVWTLHDMNPFTGGCHYSDNCLGFASNCKNCPQLEGIRDLLNANKNLNYKLQKIGNSLVSVVCLNQWMLKHVSESRLFKDMPKRIIYNCLNTDNFKPINKNFSRQLFNLPIDKTIILFVSENISNKRKGFQILLEAIHKISDKEFFFCAIGDKTQLVKNNDNIFFTGNIADERLMTILYNAADAVVIPSIEDNLPNVMLESLTCGTPVIAFPVGGILDIIEDGKNGILAKDISSESLIYAIESFVSIRDSFNTDRIREHALSLFSPNIIAEKYLDTYKDVESRY